MPEERSGGRIGEEGSGNVCLCTGERDPCFDDRKVGLGR